MTVYLALRKTPPRGVLQRLFFYATRGRLLTRYPHGGIVVGDVLYHSTAAQGVHSLSFVNDGWDLFPTDINPDIVASRFEKVEGAAYDWLSLFGFVLPWRITVAEWLYCYELCFYLLTGEFPTKKVVPETLLALVAHDQGQRHEQVVY